MSNENDNDNNKSKLVLLPGNKKSPKQDFEVELPIELTEEEEAIKARLIEVESKINSLEKIIESINDELPETFYSSEVFFTVIAGAALQAASEIVNEVFGIKKESGNPLL